MRQKLFKLLSGFAMVFLLFGGSQVVWGEEATTDSTASLEVSETSEGYSPEKELKTEGEELLSEKEIEVITEELEALVGEESGETTEVEFDLTTADGIRQGLLSQAYVITAEELAKIDDTQLLNGKLLFDRYVADVTGMDLGTYAIVLKALYVDNNLSWELIEPQLAYIPSDSTSFTAMIPDVERIQTYLQALYPPTGVIMQIGKVSNEAIVTALKELQEVEDQLQAEGKPLIAGRMAMLINRLNATGETTEESSSSSKETTVPVTSTSDSTAQEKGDKKKGLPQTGEELMSWMVPVLGVLIVAGAVVVYLKKKRSN